MNKIFSVINFGLVLTITLFLTLSIRTWTHPKYVPQTNGAAVSNPQKNLKKLTLQRRVYNAGIVTAVTQGNLFRKERVSFQVPVNLARLVPQPSNVPPPNLKLRGVMLLRNTKIAILEGTYPIMEGNNSIKNQPIKRQGYSLGSQIGNYELTQIERTSVTLDDKSGRILNIKLAKRPPDKTIRRRGNTLIQKSRNFNPKKIKLLSRPKPPAPVVQSGKSKAPQRTFRISGAPTRAPRPHISGR